MREYQNKPTSCAHQKFYFVHETVNKSTVSTRLLSDGLCSNFKSARLNKNARDIIIS